MKTWLYCPACGVRYADFDRWPRLCTACGEATWKNPIPVVSLVVPVDGGVLLVRRAESSPKAPGLLTFPGGYLDHRQETWQEAAVRELQEETHVQIAVERVREFRVLSKPGEYVFIYGITDEVSSRDWPAFASTEETSERIIAGPERIAELAWEVDRIVFRDFFARSRQSP